MSPEMSSLRIWKPVPGSTAYLGYTNDELRAAFEKVQNKTNWKLAIESYILEADYAVTAAAITYFTAGQARFWYVGLCLDDVTIQGTAFKKGDRVVLVTARGYYIDCGS